jgi:hypothetical protein
MLRVDGRLEDGSGVARPAVKMTALVSLLLLCRGRRLGLRAGLTSSPWDPEHWRQRAEQIRALLDDMRDAESRARCFALPKTTTAWRAGRKSV